jgi:fluoroacetyl-CoA thioesterase
MKTTLARGLEHEATLTVTEDLTVPRVSPHLDDFADMPPVFATAFMVGLIEATCIACIREHLDPGEHSVGTHVDVSHVAATPVGLTVTARVRLTAVDRRALTFEVEASDDAGPIGSGTHRRAVIDVERFMGKVREKASG